MWSSEMKVDCSRFETVRAYVFPAHYADMTVDEQTGREFANLILATCHEQFWAAATAMGLTVEDPNQGKRLSVSRVRNAVQDLCLVVVLAQRWRGFRCLCSCALSSKHINNRSSIQNPFHESELL